MTTTATEPTVTIIPPTPAEIASAPTQVELGPHVPSAVRAAAARADALMRPQEVEQDPQPTHPEPAPQPEASAEPARRDDPPAPAEKPVAPHEWEGRYRAMKGRYDKELPPLREEVASLRRNIIALENRLRSEPPAASADDGSVTLEDLTPEEMADYGPDFIKVVEKAAGRIVARITSRYDEKIAGLQKNLQGVQSQAAISDEERLYQTLSERVPNWTELNTDPGFLEWLKQPDRLSGQLRAELLGASFNRKDAPQVAAFFEEYEKQTTPAPRADTTSDPNGRASAPGKVPLEQYAAPGRAKSPAARGAPEDKPSFTAAQITQFFTDKARGKYRGREAEADKTEGQIFEAQREGRVR